MPKVRKSEKRTGQPYRRRLSKALDRLDALAAKYEAEGLTKVAARRKATAELRANARGDWRAG
jgi:hypothetical protein